MRVVTRLAGALARHTGQEEEGVKRHQFGKLGTCLQRGNSVILAARITAHPAPATDGQL